MVIEIVLKKMDRDTGLQEAEVGHDQGQGQDQAQEVEEVCAERKSESTGYTRGAIGVGRTTQPYGEPRCMADGTSIARAVNTEISST